MKMRNLMTLALLVNGAILASQSAFGQLSNTNYYQWYPNNLVMGFQNQTGGGTQDYIINLGPAANIVGGSAVVDLSSDFSMSDFNAVLGSSSSMFGGVIAAANTSNSGQANTADVYLTQLRSGGAGIPSIPGSSVSQQLSRSQDNLTFSQLGTLVTTNAGYGVLDTTKTWESLVDPNSGANTFQSDTGLNPDSTVSATGVLYEDLWETSSSTLSGTKPFTYLGYFTLDLTGANPKLTFTPKNAPASLTSPTIASVHKTGSTVTVVSSNAVPNYNYQLQYTPSLNPTNWVSVGSSVVAGSTTVTNTYSTAAGATGFYRIYAH